MTCSLEIADLTPGLTTLVDFTVAPSALAVPGE